MKHLLNLLFISAATLFILGPTLRLGAVVEALMLLAALMIGCLSVAGGLWRAERSLRRIEADAQRVPGA